MRKIHQDYNNYHYWHAELRPPADEPEYRKPGYMEKLLNQPLDPEFIQN